MTATAPTALNPEKLKQYCSLSCNDLGEETNYDYGFRDYSPVAMRFTTVDPIKDGLNWYSYVGNDPINFIDPNGLWTQSMGAAVYNNLGQPYVKGYNDCDAWLEKIEKEANPSSTLSKTFGAASSNTASDHKDKLKEKNLLSEDMSEGTNIVVQGEVHVMLASLNPDGSVDVAHSTSNPVNDEMMDEKGFSNGYSEVIKYDSEKEFKDAGWGDLQFYGLGDGDDFKEGGVYDPKCSKKENK